MPDFVYMQQTRTLVWLTMRTSCSTSSDTGMSFPQSSLPSIPSSKDLHGVVVESTFNRHWLVDGLMAEGYPVHLAKQIDDRRSSLWLANLLRLGRHKQPAEIHQHTCPCYQVIDRAVQTSEGTSLVPILCARGVQGFATRPGFFPP
jgi:hypothetical protein